MESDRHRVFSPKPVFGPQKRCFSGCFLGNEAVFGENHTFLGKRRFVFGRITKGVPSEKEGL